MGIILAVISGLLTAISFPSRFGDIILPNLGFLAWLSFIPLFYAIRRVSPSRAFLLTFITAFIYYSISLCWLYTALSTYGGVEPVTSIVLMEFLMAVIAIYLGLAGLTSVWLEKKTGINRFWSLPLFWVSLELARNYTPCGGFPWGNITNSQYAYLTLIQIVDVVGIYGFLYVMISVNLFGADIINSIGSRLPIAKDRLVFTVFLLAVIVFYGHFRLVGVEKAQEGQPSIRAGMIQGNIPQEEKYGAGLETENLARYTKYSHLLAKGGAELIVWPESSYPWPVPLDLPSLSPETFGTEGVENDPYVVFGALSEGGTDYKTYHNSMLFADKDGNIISRYHKTHLVPFGEYVPYRKFLFFAQKLVAPIGDFAAGKEIEPLYTDKYQIGGLVCYEDVFPEISRRQVQKGANLLLVITNDAWYGRSSAAFQHLAISVFRAIENRRWLVKAANSGISAVIDSTGRIISKTDIFQEGVLVSNVKLMQGPTIYSKFGDWFAIISLLTSALFILYGKIGKVNRL